MKYLWAAMLASIFALAAGAQVNQGSGTVVTFPTDGVHNGGSVSCTDFGGTTTVQSIPSTGATAQTFDLTTQFATTGSTFVSLNAGGNTITLNAAHITVHNGTLSSGTGGTVQADTAATAAGVPLSGITGGTNTVFRCTSTGTPPQLPSGTLTITAADCATSVTTVLKVQ